MNKVDAKDVNEGDLITFQRKTKTGETVNQLGIVSRLNTKNDKEDEPTTSFEIYLLTEDDNKPNIKKENKGLPERSTEKLGLVGKYRIYNVPLELDTDAFEDGQVPTIGSFSESLTQNIFDIIEKWEDSAGDKLKFLSPSKLAGTGFMRFTPPPEITEAKPTIKTQQTLAETVAAAAANQPSAPAREESHTPKSMHTEGEDLLITAEWGKAPNILLVEPGR